MELLGVGTRIKFRNGDGRLNEVRDGRNVISRAKTHNGFQTEAFKQSEIGVRWQMQAEMKLDLKKEPF